VRTRIFTLLSLVVVLALLLPGGVQPAAAQQPDSIVVTLQTPPRRAAVGSDGFDSVQVEGFDHFASPGDPALPGKVYNVALPPDVAWQSVSVEMLSVKTVELTGTYEIAPVRPPATWVDGRQIIAWGENAASIVDGKNTRVYQRDAYFPSSYVTSVGHSQMRKWRFVRLLFTPVQYNPVTKKLRMATEVEVRITFGRGPANQAQRRAELSDTVMDREAALILHNYGQAKGWYQTDTLPRSTSADADYVIITTDTIVVGSSNLSNFVTHKQAKGHAVEIVTETQYGELTGQAPYGTAEKIRQWLINNYLTKHIRYVLLIGNPNPAGDVPMKMCWPRRSQAIYLESPTDYFYADLTGNWDLDGDQYFCEYPDDGGSGGVDFAAEVYVGRIPVYTGVSGWQATLDNILQKTMDYENSSNVAWRRSALLPMSFSDSNTDGAPLAERMKGDYLNGAGFTSYTLYQHKTTGCNSSYSSNENLVNGAVKTRWQNNDYGIVTWWGHGSQTGAYIGYDPSCSDGAILTSSDAPSLDNGHPAFVYQNSCTNGYPEDNGNLGYALLKNGAVATVSASRVSWYAIGIWSPSRFFGDNASIGYYYMQRITNGEQAGVALYTEKGSVGSGWGGETWMNLFDFNIYGDPSISLFSAYPGAFSKSSPTNGATGQPTSLTLSWQTSSGATSYEYCYDTTNNSTCDGSWTSTGGNTSASISGLSSGTTYYWQVRARNAAGTTDADSGTWWNFTVGGTTVPNDDFNNAFVISSVPYSNSQDTTGATTATDDPHFTCVSGQKYNTVWYRYTPTASGIFTVNTFGSSYDTVLAIWTGTRGALQSKACNDDTGGLQSQVLVPVSAGTTYYIEVAGYREYSYGILNISFSQMFPTYLPLISK